MNYLIVGCGRVGSRLAKLLVGKDHAVAVVDENPAAFKRLGNHFKGHLELGTGIDYDVLRRAGAESADGFVAVTEGDNRNIMAALIAQRMFGIKKIVARIYDPPRGLLYQELGIETVCPTTVGAEMIRDKLMTLPFETHRPFDFGRLSSIAVHVGEALAGRRVGDIERDGRIRIAAIRRSTEVIVASASDVLQAEDEINVIVTPDALGEFAAAYASSAERVRLTA
jgi:trk system potassium uptake protein